MSDYPEDNPISRLGTLQARQDAANTPAARAYYQNLIERLRNGAPAPGSKPGRLLVEANVLCWVEIDMATNKPVRVQINCLPENLSVPEDGEVMFVDLDDSTDDDVPAEVADDARRIADEGSFERFAVAYPENTYPLED